MRLKDLLKGINVQNEFDDVEVLDYHDLPTSYNYNTSKFFLSGDMNIIFYDSDAGTWRYIVKRK